MPTRASKPQRPRDIPVDTRNPAAVALSKLGASKGGKARAKALTKERRSEIAKSAAKKRWGAKRMDPKDPDYVKRVAALVATRII